MSESGIGGEALGAYEDDVRRHVERRRVEPGEGGSAAWTGLHAGARPNK